MCGTEVLEDERRLARAIYAALEAGDREAFMGEFDLAKPVTIDGKFNLLAVVRALKGLL